jgi:phytoene dehydrogenase-like protein
MSQYDAVVVGAGPNGLAAAVELTRNDRRVLVVEGADVIGGGTRTDELTLPGFLHDICSAIHPLGAASPFFRAAGIGDWVQPTIPATHPLDGGRVGVLHRTLHETADGLGSDGSRYRRWLGSMVDNADDLVDQVLGPLRIPRRHPLTLTRFGAPGIVPVTLLAKGLRTEEAKGLLAGLAAHAIAPFSTPLTGAVAQLFAVSAHAYGWPLARGGSRTIADDMAARIVAGDGEIETGRMVTSLDQLPSAPIVLLDVMPDAALRIAGNRAGGGPRKRLGRWRSGPGVFKVDWALDGPVPWADEHSGAAGTVHVGGTFEEIAASEAEVHGGSHPERPFVIVTQQSLFDPSRAPEGQHTLWGYCHVPAESTVDMTDAIERQIERFAPGFRDRILARHTMGTAAFNEHNPNYVNGDIAGGAFSLRKTFQFGGSRPYRIGDGLFLCSSATPPGAGVHGMCGYHAARAALTGQG